MNQQAPLFTDAFSLCEWLLQHFEEYTDALSKRICRHGMDVLDFITLALKGYAREERLELADETLIRLRIGLRMAAARQRLNDQQLFHAISLIDRIGRQIGGWQRALNQA
ncbi:MAG: hypothetical protein L0Y43_02690 [Methylococcaceae bacterium]|nr:hypothetical protein [Methylococcaceae bacterium]